MISGIRRFLEDLLDSGDNSAEPLGEADLRRVTAALLTEIMVIDGHTDEAELNTLRKLLEEQFGLTPADSSELINLAGQEVTEATDLYQFTGLINDHFPAARKQDLVESLWRVAYADGKVDKLEEATIRKIADLIYVSHSDFIRAKHRARDHGGSA